jgi:hypothetical protein
LTDDLFRPTIEARPVPAERPWRPGSIVYPAFFGGPLAATVLGVLNGRRLALDRTTTLAIAGAGGAAIAGRLVLTAALHPDSVGRLLGSVGGLLVWTVVLAVQKRPFRAYELRDGEPASLVRPGLAAAVGCGVLEAVVLVLVVGAVTG